MDRNRYLKKRFDTREAQNNFNRNLRHCNVSHTVNQVKNPYQEIWSTEPTRRIDRMPRLKPMHMNTRSGFNKKIEDATKFNVIDEPISEKQLSQSTLRVQTKKQLRNLVDNCNACSIAIEEEVDLTEESVNDMYKTMNSSNFASRMLANHPDAHHVMGRTLTNITEAIND